MVNLWVVKGDLEQDHASTVLTGKEKETVGSDPVWGSVSCPDIGPVSI